MRFMMIVKASEKSEAGEMPSVELLEAMGKYNEELVKAGVMVAGDGLKPSSQGARVTFEGGKPRVTDGPFAETKELIGGFWIIDVKSKEEAIEWARRSPAPNGDGQGVIEIRPFYELSDYPESEPIARERELRDQIEKAKKL